MATTELKFLITADTASGTASIQKFTDAVDNLGKKSVSASESMSKHFNAFGNAATSAGKTLTAALTLPIAGLGIAAIKLAGDFEQTKIAFNTMLGSADKAAAFLKELERFAAQTPFEFKDLLEASKRMMALGFEAKQIIPTMTAIGDAVAALGGGGEMINRVTLALGQMQAKGKVSAEEMRQLAEAGIPAWKILADAIGKSIPEAMDLAQKGAIKASEAVPAIIAGMSEKFHGLMSKQSQTLLGQLSNMKDELFFTLRDLGMSLKPIATSVMDNFIKPAVSGLKSLAEWFSKLPPSAQTTLTVVAGLLAALGPLVAVLGLTASGIGSLITGFTALAGVLGGGAGIIALMGPLGIAVAAIGVAFAAWRIYEKYKEIEGLGKTMLEAEAKAKSLYEELKKQGIVIEQGSQSYENWAAALANTKQSLDAGVKVLDQHNKSVVASGQGLSSVISLNGVLTDTINKLTPEQEKLKEEVEKSLRPMDALSKVIQEQINLGFSKTNVIKLHRDEIIKATAAQSQFGYVVTDAQRALAAEALALQVASERAKDGKPYMKYFTDEIVTLDDEVSKKPLEPLRIDMDETIKLTPIVKGGISDVGEQIKKLNEQRMDLIKGRVHDVGAEFASMFNQLDDRLADNIVEWEGWGRTLLDLVKGMAKSMLSSFLDGLLRPLTAQAAGLGAALGGLLSGNKGLFGNGTQGANLSGMIGGLFGGGSGGSGGGISIPGLGGSTGGVSIPGLSGNANGGLIGTAASGLGKLFPSLGGLPLIGGLFGGASAALTGGVITGAEVFSTAGAAGAAGATAGAGGAAAGGTSAAAGSGGLMSSMGAFFTNPYTIAAIGAGLAGYGLYNAAVGPDSYEAGAKEVARDFGGVNISAGDLKKIVNSFGINESDAWSHRAELLRAPITLAYIASAAVQQDKLDEFMAAISTSGKGSWGMPLNQAMTEYLNTGNGAGLNDMFKQLMADAFIGAAKKFPDWQQKMLLPETGDHKSESFADYLAMKGNTGKIPGYKTGIDFVPQEQIVRVHPKEAILNEEDADDWRQGKGKSIQFQEGDINVYVDGDPSQKTIDAMIAQITTNQLQTRSRFNRAMKGES